MYCRYCGNRIADNSVYCHYCGKLLERGLTNSSGSINGHEYVDLGLSVKWATCNVGAESPSDYGSYYAWGEMEAKIDYTLETNATHKKKLGNIFGNPQYDVARAIWGNPWRLPNVGEISELAIMCTCEWTTQDWHDGYMITGPNGNSIFLPAAGFCVSLFFGEEGCGFYWGGTGDPNNTYLAYGLRFHNNDFKCGWNKRYWGGSVRPVIE